MATQTTYSERQSPPTAGTIAGNRHRANVSTGICETASPGIPFGRAVSQGTLSDEGVVIGGTVAGLRGCSVKEITTPAGQGDVFLPPNTLGVLEGGDIWVAPREAVAAGDPVYFVAATGIWSNNATGAVGPVKGARFKTTCGANGMAILSLPTTSQKSL
jgi:hypothetical protein